MRISVLTINYNNLRGLKRTIPSIISQTCQDFELIVVDGASKDGGVEYLKSQTRIDKLVSEPDKGIYNAMNKAVALAEGDYCIFMNSGDTFFSSETLELILPLLENHDFILGKSVYLEPTKLYPTFPPKELSTELLIAESLSHQSLFIKTSILRDVPFREDFRIVSDWEQYFRAWLVKGYKDYLPIDIFISIFYRDGISFTHRKLDRKERRDAIRDLMEVCSEEESLSMKEVKQVINKRRLKSKIDKIFTIRSPFKRDFKLLRYSFKALGQDILSLFVKH